MFDSEGFLTQSKTGSSVTKTPTITFFVHCVKNTWNRGHNLSSVFVVTGDDTAI